MWITRRRASRLLACSSTTVDRLIEIGDLQPRKGAPPRAGSLDQDEVLALATRRYAEREAATKARQDRERRKPAPPDDEYDWLSASQAAVSSACRRWVYKRVSRGTIPYTDHRGRHWFRRDHMEVMGNARTRPPHPEPVTKLAARRLAATPLPAPTDQDPTPQRM